MNGGGLDPTYVTDETPLTKTAIIQDTACHLAFHRHPSCIKQFITRVPEDNLQQMCTLMFYGDKHYLEVMTTKYTEPRRSEITTHLGQVGRIKLCCWVKHQWFWFDTLLKFWSGVLWTASHDDGSYLDAVLTYYKGKTLVGSQAMPLSLVSWLCQLTPVQCPTVQDYLLAETRRSLITEHFLL